MALNSSNKQIIAMRREIVAHCRLRGYTQRQTQMALAEKLKNPRGNKPFALGTINSDIAWLEKQWIKKANENIEQYKADILAELDEVKKQGWKDRNLNAVLSAIAQQRAVQGLDKPQKTALTDPSGENEYHGIIIMPEKNNDNGGNGKE